MEASNPEGVFQDEEIWSQERTEAMDEQLRLLDQIISEQNEIRLSQENALDTSTLPPSVLPHSSSPTEEPSASQAPIVDIEDVGLIRDRGAEYRPRGMYVTDLSSSEWCQQKIAFQLSSPLPQVVTPAMQAGKEAHAVLEAEIALDSVDIPAETREDKFAVRLMNMDQKLRQLLQEGKTRELPVSGSIQGQEIRGIIDELSLGDSGEIKVVEQKSRYQPSLPGECMKATYRLQLMTYRHLFESLPQQFGGTAAAETLRKKGLDPHRFLSDIVQYHIVTGGLPASANLVELSRGIMNTIQALPSISQEMLINYYWQGDGELLETETVKHDEELFNAAIHRHLQFWSGRTAPEKTPAMEKWKCERCQFRSKCWPNEDRRVPWQH